jgi:hypothetical protein
MEGRTVPDSAGTGTSDELLDEALKQSFPASDPLSFWSGMDWAGNGGGAADAVPEAEDAVPEAEDPGTVRAGEETEAVEGPAPIG